MCLVDSLACKFDNEAHTVIHPRRQLNFDDQLSCFQTLDQRDAGCLSLFGKAGEKAPADLHRMLADHLIAEYRVTTEGRGRTHEEWRLRLAGSDNHWLDCAVGCAVAASMQGVSLPVTQSTKPVPRKRGGPIGELKGRGRGDVPPNLTEAASEERLP